jgi:hypothetical protein
MLGSPSTAMMSSPILGDFSTCSVVWLNDDPEAISDVDVHFLGMENSHTFSWTLKYNEPINFVRSGLLTGYCTVEWFGQPSDVKATFCNWDIANDLNGCVELRR